MDENIKKGEFNVLLLVKKNPVGFAARPLYLNHGTGGTQRYRSCAGINRFTLSIEQHVQGHQRTSNRDGQKLSATRP